MSSPSIDRGFYPRVPIKENILLLATCRGLEIIDIHSILRIEAISNYSKLFFTDGRCLVVAKLLSWFEKKLTAEYFVRLHRGHLVNMRYIKRCENLSDGEVVLVNNEKLSVSRRKRVDFKKAIYRYYGQAVQFQCPQMI
jgi:two-component system, LytTR family, response regulator